MALALVVIDHSSIRWIIADKNCIAIGPSAAAFDRNPKSKLRAEKEQVRFDKVFLNDMRVSANAFDVLCSDERRPRFSVIGSFENIRRHVAESVPIESCVCSARVEAARLHPANPGILWQTRNITDHIVPRFPAITGELKVAVI